jgi:hypothetical protein
MAFGAYRLDAAFTIKSFNPTTLLIALKDVMFPFGNIRERQLEQNSELLVNSDVLEKFKRKEDNGPRGNSRGPPLLRSGWPGVRHLGSRPRVPAGKEVKRPPEW